MRYLLLCAAVLVLISCNGKKYRFKLVEAIEKDPAFEQIELQNYRSKEVNLSALFKKIEYIRLETNDDCLIGSISKLFFFDNKIFVLDTEKAYALFAFSNTGKFLFKLTRGIGGPGEFTEITDVTINETDSTLYVLSREQRLLYEYDRMGHFIKTIHIPPYIDNVQCVRDGAFLLYRESKHFSQDRLSNSRLFVLARDGNIKVGWFTNSLNTHISLNITDPIVPAENATFSIARPYENIIYSYNPGSRALKMKYYLNFGDNDLVKLSHIPDFEQWNHFVKDYSFNTGNAFDRKSYLYFMFYDKQKIRHYFKDKRTGQEWVTAQLTNDMDYIPPYPFQFGNDSCLISIVPSTTIKQLYSGAVKEEKKDIKLQAIFKYGAGTDEMDNPVIAKYILK